MKSILGSLILVLALGSLGAAPKRIALVFDDGPRPADAGPLLAVLAAEKVRVTFALVGDRVNENPATARAIAAAGHDIADHSQTHGHPKDFDAAALEREVTGGRDAIRAAVGIAPRWYWPPYLETDDRLRDTVTRAGLTLYFPPHHLVVSKDYERSVPAAEIYRLATTDVRDGAVILFHEWRAETREQLPAILAELRRQGCTFHTFSELHAQMGLPPALAAPVAAPAPAATAAEPVGIPPGGEPMFTGDVLAGFNTSVGQGIGDAISITRVNVTGAAFSRALHIETTRDLSPPWAGETRVPIERPVKKGDTALLRFYARRLASADETGMGQVRVVVQRAGPNYQKSLESTVSVGADWQEFLMPFAFSDDYAKFGAEVSFGFGFKRQTVEIGGIELLHYGGRVTPAALPRTRFTYAGREADAAWRREALARIEKLRKSAFLIEVKDAAGQPVAGATVRVEQRRSAFQFGSALQFARLVQDSPDNKIYREKVIALFNAASPENDLKWPVWNGEWEGAFDRKQSLAALAWLRENNFHVRGHVLVWPGWKNLPKSVGALKEGKANQAKIPPLVLQHIADITGATRQWVQEWDVLNEPYDNHDLMALFGTDIMVDWFKAAQAGAAPGAPLYLNDYSNHDLLADKAHCADFFKVAKFLQSKGAPLGGLGLQGHIGARPNPPERVLATLDAYAEFKLPIRITEFDVDTEDEQLQADYTRDFLILAYSHPSVVGLQHWGFWERAHWRPRGALFRANWSPKPAANVYEELVLKQWRTKLQGKIGASGKVGGRGFHGDYTATVELDGRRAEAQFSLTPAEERTVLQVTLP